TRGTATRHYRQQRKSHLPRAQRSTETLLLDTPETVLDAIDQYDGNAVAVLSAQLRIGSHVRHLPGHLKVRADPPHIVDRRVARGTVSTHQHGHLGHSRTSRAGQTETERIPRHAIRPRDRKHRWSRAKNHREGGG